MDTKGKPYILCRLLTGTFHDYAMGKTTFACEYNAAADEWTPIDTASPRHGHCTQRAT